MITSVVGSLEQVQKQFLPTVIVLVDASLMKMKQSVNNKTMTHKMAAHVQKNANLSSSSK